MRLVVLESPYAGDTERNVRYARECLLDCLRRGESPIASHLLFPQILDDLKPEERSLGINAGHAWIKVCSAVAVYQDYGISDGMSEGIRRGSFHGKPVLFRNLYGEKGCPFDQ